MISITTIMIVANVIVITSMFTMINYMITSTIGIILITMLLLRNTPGSPPPSPTSEARRDFCQGPPLRDPLT